MAVYEITTDKGVYQITTEDATKPMFADQREAEVGMQKARREQFEAEQGVTPLGVASRAMNMIVRPMENQALAGVPEMIARSRGEKFVPEDAQMKELSGAVGVLAGLPGGVATAITKRLIPSVGAKLGQKVIGNASAGAAGGFLTSPENPTNIGQRTAQGVGGAVVGGAIPLVSSGVNFLKNVVSGMKDVKDPVGFANNVRTSLFARKAEVGREFEAGISALEQSKPNVKVDLSQSIQSLRSAMDDATNNPGLASQVKSIIRGIKDPDTAKMIQEIIDDPSKASQLTLKDSNKIKTAIQNAPAIATKLKQGKFAQFNQGDLELLDLLDEVKLSQAENFPELSAIRKPYAEYMNQYRQVKNMFKPSQLLDKAKNGFGNEEIEKMVKHVLPDATNLQISAYRNALKGKKIIRWGLGTATATALGTGVIGALNKMSEK